MTEEKKGILRLSFVEKELFESAPSDLNSYNKDDIARVLRPTLALLRQYDIELAPGGEAEAECEFRNMLMSSGYLPKKDSLARVAILLSYIPSNLVALSRADATVKSLWSSLLMGSMRSYADVTASLGREPAMVFSSSRRALCEPALALASFMVKEGRGTYYSAGNQASKSEFFASSDIRRVMIPFILGEDAGNPHVTEGLPEKGLAVVSGLDGLSEALVDLSQMALGGYIASDDKTATLRRYSALARKAGIGRIDAFPPNISGPVDTSAMTVMAYCCYRFADGTGDGAPDVAAFGKFVADRLGQFVSGNALQTLLPNMKGFTYLYRSNYLCGSVSAEIRKLVAPSAEGWLALDNFFLRYRGVRSNNHTAPFLLPLNFAFRDSRYLRVADGDSTHDVTDYFGDVARPYALHWLALLCATGLAELAVDSSAPVTDELGGLRYMRLTALGRYAFGVSDTFDGGDAKEKKVMFDLDDERHIVSLLERNKFIEPYLERIGRMLSPGRYKVDVRTILGAASTPEAIEGLYTSFCNTVCAEPSAHWRELFDEAKVRTRSFSPVDDKTLVVKLDPNVPGLLDFVVSNREISEHCFKAEGAMLIVPRSYYNDFLTLMRQAGYLTAVQKRYGPLMF